MHDSVVFLARACPIAAAPFDRILLSHRFRVVRLHRPFNNLPTALAPLSLILLCERSEKVKCLHSDEIFSDAGMTCSSKTGSSARPPKTPGWIVVVRENFSVNKRVS